MRTMGSPDGDLDPLLEFVVPSTIGASRIARRKVSDLRSVVGDLMYQDMALLLSELVTNSVRHGSLDDAELIHVRVECRPGYVSVEVVDGGTGFEQPQKPVSLPSPGSGQGYGLAILDALSSNWGTTRLDGRMKVWFELEGSNAAPRDG